MPLFAWYMLITAGMMLIGFPPLILGSILLELERAFGWPFYDPAFGGDSVLWQHLFWLFGHPEVYIIFVPAAGMVTTMLATFASRPIVAYRWVVASLVAIGILSMVLWAHHMFTVGLSVPAATFFSVASTLIAIPTSVQFFIWIATMWSGRVRWELPMLFMAGFFVTFIVGGLTGVMIALVPFNWQAHDTHFIVAHLHYVLVGGMVFPVLAAAYYWLPHFTGRMPSKHLGKVSFWLIFLGFHLTFLPMHLTGLAGMPRRVHTYSSEMGWDALNLVSSIGGFMQAVGFAVFVIDIVVHARVGRLAPRNPWSAGSLEWAMPTPAPSYNFASIPEVTEDHPLWQDPNIPDDAAAGRLWLAEPSGGRRLTLSVETSSGRPDCVIVLPGSSWWPLAAGVATAGFFTGVLLKFYGMALLALALAVAFFLCWAWATGSRIDAGALKAKEGVSLPLHFEHSDAAPGWHGTILTLIADAAVLGSLLFGAIYLWVLASGWPPAEPAEVSIWVAAVVAVGWVVAILGTRTARPLMDAGSHNRKAMVGLGLQLFAVVLALAVVSWALSGLPPANSHAQVAVSAALLWYGAIHLGIATIMSAFLMVRWRSGFVSMRRDLEPRVVWLFGNYALGSALLCSALAVAIGW